MSSRPKCPRRRARMVHAVTQDVGSARMFDSTYFIAATSSSYLGHPVCLETLPSTTIHEPTQTRENSILVSKDPPIQLYIEDSVFQRREYVVLLDGLGPECQKYLYDHRLSGTTQELPAVPHQSQKCQQLKLSSLPTVCNTQKPQCRQ